MQTTSRRARRPRPGGTLVLLAFHGLGKIAIFCPCKAKPILQAHARGRRLTRRSSSERWRPETAGACTKSSAAPAPPTGRSRSGTTGSASRRSSEETSPIARTPANDCSIPARCCSETMARVSNAVTAHGIGDRCISLNVCEEQFSEIAAVTASTSRFRFSAPSLPPSPKALPIIAQMEALSFAPSSLRWRSWRSDHRARHRPDGRRSTGSGRADRTRDETGDRSDPTGRIRRGATA